MTNQKVISDTGDQGFEKIFQYDEKVLLVGEKKYQILEQSDLSVVKEVESGDCDINTVSIVNKTLKDKKYTIENQTVVHPQDWVLVYRSKATPSVVFQNELDVGTKETKPEAVKEKDIGPRLFSF